MESSPLEPSHPGALSSHPRSGKLMALMAVQPHLHRVQVYYEDTDHSGVVYHANYLKYFERAREHFFGIEALKALASEQGLGFVVYRAELSYRKGAVFGDSLRIRSCASLASPYRVSFEQSAQRERDGQLLVQAQIDMVMLNAAQKPVAFPACVCARISAQG